MVLESWVADGFHPFEIVVGGVVGEFVTCKFDVQTGDTGHILESNIIAASSQTVEFAASLIPELAESSVLSHIACAV